MVASIRIKAHLLLHVVEGQACLTGLSICLTEAVRTGNGVGEVRESLTQGNPEESRDSGDGVVRYLNSMHKCGKTVLNLG